MAGRVFKYKLLNSIVATSNPSVFFFIIIIFFYIYCVGYVGLGWAEYGNVRPTHRVLQQIRYELRSISDFAAGKNL